MLKKEQIEKEEARMMGLIEKEFQAGFDFIRKYPRTVTFFGSARLKTTDPHYAAISNLSGRIAKELGFTIVTGGGPGVMEAANKGAREAGGGSIGISIILPKEQNLNPYLDDSLSVEYFFVRRTMLTFSAETFIFGPGGFGTFDELFEILTLVQTKKIPAVPIILFGRDYWQKVDDLIQNHLYKTYGAIGENDSKIYKITDSAEEVIDIIKNAPVVNWWQEFEI